MSESCDSDFEKVTSGENSNFSLRFYEEVPETQEFLIKVFKPKGPKNGIKVHVTLKEGKKLPYLKKTVTKKGYGNNFLYLTFTKLEFFSAGH